ncbi:MAG: sigma-54 dependent transcriptional regulator [bacterium]|jgi:two-component system response regulator PilR (NtrC family)|nr:sigma-54 dependent transcriptional regulator [bacterium]
MESNRILVIDDELSMRQFLEILLKKDGYSVDTAENGAKAIEMLKKNKYSVILMDYNMPEAIDGIDLLNELRIRSRKSQIIVITAFASTEQAIKAIELGAVDYVSKPFNVAEIRDIVKKCISIEADEDAHIKEPVTVEKKSRKHESPTAENVVAESSKMLKILEIAKQIAPTDSTVLLTGDSGTGKEVVARYIHANSGRSNKPWYPVNCGAIPENLLESELFGHEKGSFTGAYRMKKGYFEVAGDGTLFLDEIGELSENMQVKLLRVLQEKNFTRVGGTEKISTNVRLIAATNRNLKEQMQKGKFREDLYFRLNVLELYIPPLNERRDDILPLANFFLEQFSRKSGVKYKFSKELIDFFMNYPFPGNVRELKNIIERGTVFAKDGLLTKTHFENAHKISEKITKDLSIDVSDNIDLDEILAEIEKKYIIAALKKTDYNRHDTCVLLNISERSLRYRISKLGIKDDE